MNYYRILNVNTNASQEEIKRAYRRLSRKYHPDNAGEQYREKFDSVQEAYAVLGDEEKREVYDRQIVESADGHGQDGHSPQMNKSGQYNKQENYYRDLEAFYTGAYKNSFDKFFGAGLNGQTAKKSDAQPVNTDRLFESFFKFK